MFSKTNVCLIVQGLSCNDYYIISDDDDDDDDEYDDDNLPSNELYLKVKLFRNLCLGNVRVMIR